MFYKPDGAFWGQEAPIYSAVAELSMKYIISDLKRRKRRRKRKKVDATFRVLTMIRLESN